MDEILKQTLLYDFYGELLTKHQKEIYEQAVLEDYSLSEIARDAGISRQGVHDMIRRCNKSLEDYEAKLHLVEKFMSVKKKVHEIDLLLENYEELNKQPSGLKARLQRSADDLDRANPVDACKFGRIIYDAASITNPEDRDLVNKILLTD